MNKNPLISFILPNYNNEHVLDLFFEKFIFHNTYDNYEFIIVDDGSEDNSLEVLYKWKNSGKIKNMLIIKEPHLGIINALNKALFLTKGELSYVVMAMQLLRLHHLLKSFWNFII